jgi:hypothetical protein
MTRLRTSLLLAPLALAALFPWHAAASASRIDPTSHAGALRVDLGNKSSLYHKATKAQPFEFRVKGPLVIRVLSRYLFEGPESAEPTSYGLVLAIDNLEIKKISETANVSKKATLDDAPIGTLERATVTIPAGDHKVRVHPTGENEVIALRLFKGDGKKAKLKWVTFAPQVYEKALRLQGRDSEVTYYRLTRDHKVELTLRGPMRLKVMSRVDFGTERGHTQAYVIKVLLDEEEWKSYPLKSRASHISTYPEMPEITPGMGKEFSLKVPEGDHKVTLVLDCTTSEGASVRILVVERDLLAVSP